MATNSFTPLVNGDSQLQQSQNEKLNDRLTSWSWRNSSALAAALYTFVGAAMLMMYILLSSSSSTSSSLSSTTSTTTKSGALIIRSNVIGSTTIDSSILSRRDGNNNDPNYSPDGPSSSLRAAAATNLVSSSSSNNAVIVSSSGEGKMGGCRTTGSSIPYNGQTFGEPLYNLDFQAASYAKRTWKDQLSFDTFDEAWQACAIQCNNEHKCHTYTVQIAYDDGQHHGHRFKRRWIGYNCYLHDSYKSLYILDNVDWPPIAFDFNYEDGKEGHVSGVCRLNK